MADNRGNTSLNNQNDRNADINCLNAMRHGIQRIICDKINSKVLGRKEHEIWEDYITSIKPKGQTCAINYVQKLETPLNYNRIIYRRFET